MPSSDVPKEAAPLTPPVSDNASKVGKENKKANGVAKDAAPVPTTGSAASLNGAALTGAALKAQKKAEKAAKRAAVISQRPAGAPAGAPTGAPTGPPGSGAKADIPQGQGKKQSPQDKRRGSVAAKESKETKKTLQQEKKPWIEEPKPKVEDKTVELFRHLYKKRATTTAGWKDVHPAVQALGQQMRTYIVCGSTARLVAMMQAFQRVIEDYNTPGGATFTRHFMSHVLSPQIEYLIACRPLSVSMGNAVRWLKLQIAKIDPDEEDTDAKAKLCKGIDDFLRERVTAAGHAIAQLATDSCIVDGDVILTYAKSNSVQLALAKAKAEGKRFSVVVVDSRPLFEGKSMAKSLISLGIDVKYSYMNGLGHCMKSATKVFLGAHAMMSNGVLYSRVGTAQVAMEAKDLAIPVIVLCEVVKCTDKVALDSIVFNEVADPDELEFPGWRDVKGLQVLNIMHDATPAEYISSVLTETGIVPPSSVPVLQRWAHDRDEKKDERDDEDE